jgi:hypothetical protein
MVRESSQLVAARIAMKFELHAPWPVGPLCVPTGTVFDSLPPTWAGVVLPVPLPIDGCWALDDEAMAKMKSWYSHDLHHRLQFGPLVKKRS